MEHNFTGMLGHHITHLDPVYSSVPLQAKFSKTEWNNS